MSNDTEENAVYVFSHSTLLKALAQWEVEQIKAFKHKEKEIHTTVIAMQYFMKSTSIKDNKMLVSGKVENFIIEKPVTLDKWEDLEK